MYHGINRNILECKGKHQLQHCNHISVLIETYWNVKKECINYMYTVEVLIETYWNVKLRGAYTNVLTDSVLIETYWNVKDDSFCASEWHLGINRNILECKV